MTIQRQFSLSILILSCIGSIWYFTESMDRTSAVYKDGLVPPKETIQRLDLIDRRMTVKEVHVPVAVR
ncbi:hypothetical protein HOLleu_44600 [Holothuria leucospilota]|uniref:Uncharacterized protein n=1 Tax=Holothuria leucospilota TaxID=206669 RepID=A0A9Q1B8L7_HOLLE|nr:hypothetical protein HOLleu_44600 [Holothuria leucospilota]